jgi:glycosyltransferase involved in cell wall biosynthesis
MTYVLRARTDARLVLVGGKADQIERARGQARASGIDASTIFAGERPAAEIPAYLLAADVLVSPRLRGTNTPLKIYQYLRSGKPIVATRLLTHTQVLTDETAILTGSTPREFAEGILAALTDRQRAAAIGARARELADTKYSEMAYLDRTREACQALFAPRSAAATTIRAQGACERAERGEGDGASDAVAPTPRNVRRGVAVRRGSGQSSV